ncbi:MAG: Oxaloacetate decarboxylase, gamma chain [Rhodobacteraceae bacterium HLUCCA08]|nr:MAG: Oxaloacetate decarboxylase, gamma chain [Rhodobacteraceae bacterium HLUCCA08]
MRFLQLIVLGFVALTVIYWLVSIYSRSVRREKLENSWAEEAPEGADEAMRDAYIAEGMAKYENGLRKKLILLIYVIPPVVTAAIILAIN